MLVDEELGNFFEWKFVPKDCLVIEVFKLLVHQLPAFFFLFINVDHRYNEFSLTIMLVVILESELTLVSNVLCRDRSSKECSGGLHLPFLFLKSSFNRFHRHS